MGDPKKLARICSKFPFIVIAAALIFMLYTFIWYKSPSSEMVSSQNLIYLEKYLEKKQDQEMENIHLKPYPKPEIDFNPIITTQSPTKSPTKPPITRRQDIINKLTEALKPKNRRITLLINSCGRLHLLNRTITSFLKYYPHEKYPIHEKIIIDDCRNATVAHELISTYYPDFEIVFTANNEYEQKFSHRDERITNAMDKVWKQVT